MSEIDDIFAKSKKRKRKPSTPEPKDIEESLSKKRPLPETVVADVAGPSKRRKEDSISNKKSKPKKPKKINKKTTEFEDSRGSGNRKSNPLTCWPRPYLLYVSIGRKTEEGWSVYKEDELGLNGGGGGK